MKKRILIAPLNWGLGHATRCIPIIKALSNTGFEPVIASDGAAFLLLQKEFPLLTFFKLPSYNISYPKNGKFFKTKMLYNTPKILKAIKDERKATKRIIITHNISGIISDNRLGVYHKQIPCAFITHQICILSGYTTWLSTKINQKYLQRFDECWVPDNKGDVNLSGKLGHADYLNLKIKYIGPLSRFKKVKTKKYIDVLILLSGPEPQRSILEKHLRDEINVFNGNVVIIRGVLEKLQKVDKQNNRTTYNFMTTTQLEHTINASKVVISRSGYTTIMDLAKLEKTACLIPTPGQTEQEYLAKRLTSQGFAFSCSQDKFRIEMLHTSIKNYKGLKALNTNVNFDDLFSLF